MMIDEAIDSPIEQSAETQTGVDSGQETATQANEQSADTQAIEYTDFAVPDGVTLDPELTVEFKTIAKELGIKQESAQKMTDIAVKLSQKIELHRAQQEAEKIEQWKLSSSQDKEFGGDKFQENLSIAKKTVDSFATDEFKKFINETGVGNHPEVIRLFYKIGLEISEDSFIPGKGVPEGTKTLAQKLYPNMNP